MEPLRSAEYQMGEEGYWSWVWSMIFVFVGTLLIVGNHLVRNFLRKKKGTYKVVIAISVVLLTSNKFEIKVTYNGFNVGLMILVLGVSVLLGLAISLPILFDGLKNKQLQNE